MHLRRQRHSQDHASHSYHSAEGQEACVTTAPASKQEPDFQWDRSSLSREIREFAAARKVLQKKIHEIENRLRFGFSAPLHAYKITLMKEDIQLSCKITDLLIDD